MPGNIRKNRVKAVVVPPSDTHLISAHVLPRLIAYEDGGVFVRRGTGDHPALYMSPLGRSHAHGTADEKHLRADLNSRIRRSVFKSSAAGIALAHLKTDLHASLAFKALGDVCERDLVRKSSDPGLG